MNTQFLKQHQDVYKHLKQNTNMKTRIKKWHRHEYTNPKLTSTRMHKLKNDTNMNTQILKWHEHEYTILKTTPRCIQTSKPKHQYEDTDQKLTATWIHKSKNDANMKTLIHEYTGSVVAHWAQSCLKLWVYYEFSMSLTSSGSSRAKLAVDPFITRQVYRHG